MKLNNIISEGTNPAKAANDLKNAILAKLDGKESGDVSALQSAYAELVGAEKAKMYADYVKRSHAEKK